MLLEPVFFHAFEGLFLDFWLKIQVLQPREKSFHLSDSVFLPASLFPLLELLPPDFEPAGWFPHDLHAQAPSRHLGLLFRTGRILRVGSFLLSHVCICSRIFTFPLVLREP